MTKLVLSIIFWIAVLTMLFLAFLWPVIVDPDPGSPLLRLACLFAFAAYLVAVLGRLAIRLSVERQAD